MTRTYTQAELDAAVAAAAALERAEALPWHTRILEIQVKKAFDAGRAKGMREAAKIVAHYYGKGQVTKPEDILARVDEIEKKNK